MPVSSYFKGKGEQVMRSMASKYGAEKGKRVFYATAAKQHMKPKKGRGSVLHGEK